MTFYEMDLNELEEAHLVTMQECDSLEETIKVLEFILCDKKNDCENIMKLIDSQF